MKKAGTPDIVAKTYYAEGNKDKTPTYKQSKNYKFIDVNYRVYYHPSEITENSTVISQVVNHVGKVLPLLRICSNFPLH